MKISNQNMLWHINNVKFISEKPLNIFDASVGVTTALFNVESESIISEQKEADHVIMRRRSINNTESNSH